MSDNDEENLNRSSAYWQREVEGRHRHYLRLVEFIEQAREEDRISTMCCIAARHLAEETFARAGGREYYTQLNSKPPPATAAWAAVLKQANHVLTQAIMNYAPGLGLHIPNDDAQGPAR